MLKLNWVVFKRRTNINNKQEHLNYYSVVGAMICFMVTGLEVGYLKLKQYIGCLEKIISNGIPIGLSQRIRMIYWDFYSKVLDVEFWSFTFRDEAKLSHSLTHAPKWRAA